MDDAFQEQFTELWDEVRSAAVPGVCNDSAAWCIDQLPPLYAMFHETCDSRYADQITRLIQGVLNDFATNPAAGPKAQSLAATIPDRLRLMHEQFGLPGFKLKTPGVKPPAKKPRAPRVRAPQAS